MYNREVSPSIFPPGDAPLFLREYKVFETSRLDELREVLPQTFETELVASKLCNGRFTLNRLSLGSAEISFLSSTFDLTLDHRPRGRHVFAYQTGGKLTVTRHGETTVMSHAAPGVYLEPRASFRTMTEGPAGALSLRLLPERVNEIARVLLDDDALSVRFTPPASDDIRFHDDLRMIVLGAAREVDRIPRRHRDRFFQEFDDVLHAKVLLHSPNDAIAPWRSSGGNPLRRVEDYIDANYGQAITLRALAQVANQSGRTVWRAFVQQHGMTPRQYISMVRLTKARHRIVKQSNVSIMQIGLSCGFNSLGFFARSYRDLFGELPSQTRARALKQ
jgi:AraC-like DNA-binding protein